MANVNVGTSRDFTPADDAKDTFTLIMVTGGAGSVSFTQEGGNVITLATVPVGVWIPVGNSTRINATGTTATGLMVV